MFPSTPSTTASAHRASRRLVRFALAGASALALTACTVPATNSPALGWTPASAPKDLEVERAAYGHTVRFATDSAALEPEEQERLATFLRHAAPGPRDTIRIEGHADERASDAYNLDLAARRLDRVRRVLEDLGYGDRPLQEAAYGERVPSATASTPEAWKANRRVEVVIERALVVLPSCPDWSRESGTDFANRPHTNFGCATRTNLGLMIAEPRDLERGRTLGPADGTQAAGAVDRYRADEIKELEVEGLD